MTQIYNLNEIKLNHKTIDDVSLTKIILPKSIENEVILSNSSIVTPKALPLSYDCSEDMKVDEYDNKIVTLQALETLDLHVKNEALTIFEEESKKYYQFDGEEKHEFDDETDKSPIGVGVLKNTVVEPIVFHKSDEDDLILSNNFITEHALNNFVDGRLVFADELKMYKYIDESTLDTDTTTISTGHLLTTQTLKDAYVINYEPFSEGSRSKLMTYDAVEKLAPETRIEEMIIFNKYNGYINSTGTTSTIKPTNALFKYKITQSGVGEYDYKIYYNNLLLFKATGLSSAELTVTIAESTTAEPTIYNCIDNTYGFKFVCVEQSWQCTFNDVTKSVTFRFAVFATDSFEPATATTTSKYVDIALLPKYININNKTFTLLYDDLTTITFNSNVLIVGDDILLNQLTVNGIEQRNIDDIRYDSNVLNCVVSNTQIILSLKTN